MEDLAWLCLRSWRFGNNDRHVGGFGGRPELYDAYVANGGEAIDEDEVRWWEIFGLVRWAILNVMQAHGHITGQRRSASFAACGRNACTIEYDLCMTMLGRYT
jgi:aminoglycoside phosphotransferase (APT) family kinase protein